MTSTPSDNPFWAGLAIGANIGMGLRSKIEGNTFRPYSHLRAETMRLTPVTSVVEMIIRSTCISQHDDLARFDALKEWWLQERPRGLELTQALRHPAYQNIIQMGESAIPFLLNELQHGEPRYWFWALHATSIGVNPVPPEDAGNIERMVEAWLLWGREMGYIS